MIKTRRLTLRPIHTDDSLQLSPVLLNHQHMQYTVKKTDAASCVEYFYQLEQQWQQRGFGVWCLIERFSGETVGWGGLTIDDEEPGWGEELIYFLKPEKCGCGYALEMAQAALDFGFQQLKLNKVAAFAHASNGASQALLTKLKFEFIRYVPELERRYFEVSANQNNQHP